MSEKFRAEVVTPTGVILDKQVEEAIVPGTMGEFGVLIGHTPMLTFVKPGIFSYLDDGKFVKFVVGEGFCEVLKDSVSVLVEEAHMVEDIDKNDATSELLSLEQQLTAVDQAENPAEYRQLVQRIQVARAKVTLLSGGGTGGH
jgi:F-type H+-transporting ATPase subunit epsilon